MVCRKYHRLIFIILITLFGGALSYAQINPEEDGEDAIEYRVEANSTFSHGENTPFWLVSNMHGLGAPMLNNGFVKGEIHKTMDSDSRFNWGAGADIAGAWNLPASVSIRQLYAELHYRAIWVSIGAKNHIAQYNDERLSSGDLLFSGNAMAIPQFKIGTYGFAPVWGTKGFFSVKAYLSYGFFTDSNWEEDWVAPNSEHNKNVLFCGRGLWLRFGNRQKFPLTFDVGIEMGTQFGGQIFKDQRWIKMPTRFIDWIKAIVPLAGSADTPIGEQTNVQGNMAGEYTINASYSPAPGWNIRAYFEHYFEDHSQMTFEYGPWKDGLWGLELTFPENRFVSKFVYEYVSTKDQTGAVNNDYTPEIPEQVSGRDNYFNHYLYGCWQNWGMSIGTPLALSPLYNKSHLLTIYNTRFIANHFGLEGNPAQGLKWRVLLTFSRNWGSYWRPLREITDNFSGLAEIDYRPKLLKGFYVKGAVALDHGHLLGNNIGGRIALGYEGALSLKCKKK